MVGKRISVFVWLLLCVVPAAAGDLPAPSAPDATAVLNAQAAGAEYFFRSQLQNANSRLAAVRAESNRDDRRNSFQLSLTRPAAPGRNRTADAGNGAGPSPAAVFDSINLTHLGTNSAAGVASALTPPPPPSRWSMWYAGTAAFEDSGDAPADAFALGNTFGLDFAFGDRLTAGAALGYSRDRSAIGGTSSQMAGDSYAAMLYGSYAFDPGFYLEGMLGVSDFSLESRHWDAAARENGRDGGQYFGSAALGRDFRWKRLVFTPFSRFETAFTRFDKRSGDADLFAATLGASVRRTFALPWGELTPSAGAEYVYNFKDNSGIARDYSVPGTPHHLHLPPLEVNDSVAVVAGMEALVRENFRLGVNYRGTISPDAGLDHTLTFQAGWRF